MLPEGNPTKIVKAGGGHSIVRAGPVQAQMSLPDVPTLAKAMGDVFKVGGWPLAALFVVALLILVLIAKGVVSQAVGFFQTVTIILTVSSVVTLFGLAAIAYLRWRAELDLRRDIYRSETELQDKFILQLIQYAMTGNPEWTPTNRKDAIDAITNSMVNLIRGVSTARQELRADVVMPRTSTEAQGNNPPLNHPQAGR